MQGENAKRKSYYAEFSLRFFPPQTKENKNYFFLVSRNYGERENLKKH